MRLLLFAGVLPLLTVAGWGVAQEPASQPHPVPVTRLELKKALEAYKSVKPRLPAPPEGEEKASGRSSPGQVRMRVLYLDPDLLAVWPRDYTDEGMSLSRHLKSTLLWVTSRVNNCLY